MKKVLFLLLMCMPLLAMAQDIELNDQGAYEKKEVVEVTDATAAILFGRAMEALSDWTGPDGNSKVGIDYQDKEAGTVIYKGTYYIEYKFGVLSVANFTLKVRCKDGKAQVTVNIPTLTNTSTKLGMERIIKLIDIKEKPRRGDNRNMQKVPAIADTLLSAMRGRLATPVDDDF